MGRGLLQRSAAWAVIALPALAVGVCGFIGVVRPFYLTFHKNIDTGGFLGMYSAQGYVGGLLGYSRDDPDAARKPFSYSSDFVLVATRREVRRSHGLEYVPARRGLRYAAARHMHEKEKPIPPGIYGSIELAIKAWPAFVVLALPPVFLLVRGPIRRWGRRRRGLCVACGYNLTGNVSGLCPECGSDLK